MMKEGINLEIPYNLITTISPVRGKKINTVNKKSKYVVKVMTPVELEETLFKYSENFFEAAHMITEFILYAEHPDIGKLDMYFFPIAFLYRHCIELGLKAIGFQYIEEKAERQRLIKDTRHNLFEILSVVKEKSTVKRPEEEIEWMEKYFADLTKTDRESDSFRYPFHIVWEKDEWGLGGKFVVKPVFNEQIDIDLVKFANKFEAAYEIIQKWYKKETDSAAEWKDVKPIFIETGGYYYSQSVVGYTYSRAVFYPYTEAYLETANYLKWYMKMQTDKENTDFKERLFLPMCYLYRNCVELSLKAVWFEETGEDFQKKCKIMLDNKHSIGGMWKNIKPYVLEYNGDGEKAKYIEVIEDYCMQLHTIDSDANKFRYPMSNSIQPYFSHNKRFDFIETGDFLEALNNILDGIDSELNTMNEIKAEMQAEYYSYLQEDMDYYM